MGNTLKNKFNSVTQGFSYRACRLSRHVVKGFYPIEAHAMPNDNSHGKVALSSHIKGQQANLKFHLY
jgi:hypothetical protein